MNKKPYITVYIVKDKATGRELRCAGYDSKEDLFKNGLSNASSYEFARTEAVEYNHADTYCALAAALPGDWEAKPISKEHKDCGFSLRRADGLAIFGRCGGYQLQDKHEFMYSQPRDSKRRCVDVYRSHGRVSCPSIKCSAKKSADQLAKDIERRLLPDCEEVHPLFLEAIERAEACYYREEVAKRAADELKDGHGVSFRVNGSSISISGYLEPSKAKKLSNFLQTL